MSEDLYIRLTDDQLAMLKAHLKTRPWFDDQRNPELAAERRDLEIVLAYNLELREQECERPTDDPSPTAQSSAPPPDDLVTLDQMAAVVHRSKRTLEGWKKDCLPPPDFPGGNGKADYWHWSTVRPALEAKTGFDLRERFPGSRLID